MSILWLTEYTVSINNTIIHGYSNSSRRIDGSKNIGIAVNRESLRDMPIRVPSNPHPIAASAMKRSA